MLTDPSAVLALVKLTLPPGVTDAIVKSKPLTGLLADYRYAYTVSWHGTIETTEQFLAQQGYTLDTALPAHDSDRNTLLNEMVIDYIPEGSRRVTYAVDPYNGRDSTNTLILAPGFADVYVSIALLPFR